MSGSAFKDHFSGHAGDYARSRPSYPDALFAHLASLSPLQQLAWDCATGNGQAALGLALHFEHVVASDASAEQIAHGFPHDRVACSVDLVTIGQALHWIDLERFYAEVRRVLRPHGVVAAWCYKRCTVAPDIDTVVDRYHAEIVGPFWPPERVLVETGYRTLNFPFERISMPGFCMQADWTAEELLAYLGTWSATKRYQAERGRDPREAIKASLVGTWGSPHARRRIQWPLSFLAGRNG
jgi:SAM-dependent methyltransferase